MRAYIIDAQNKNILETEFNKETSLKFMQNAVGGRIERATTINETDDVYVDEEGLLKRQENFFTIFGAGPFAGNGVVVGHNPENGDVAEAKISIEELRRGVRFLSIFDITRASGLSQFLI